MGFGNNRNQQQRKGRWAIGEDELLKGLVSQCSVDDDIDWSVLEQHFNGTRDSKQIRERWVNHLSPSIKKRRFNDKEIKIIEDECAKHKFKWSKISKKIPNATPLMIKNFYNNRLKKKHPPIRRLGNSHDIDTQKNTCANTNTNVNNNNNNNNNFTKLIDNPNYNDNNNLTTANLIRNNHNHEYLSPEKCYYNEHSSLSRSSSVRTVVNDDNSTTFTLSRNSSVRTMVNDNYLVTPLPSPHPSDFVKPTMQEMSENVNLQFLATVAGIASYTSESPSPTDPPKRSKKMSISSLLT